MNPLLTRLQHHVSGAIERGETVAIVEQPRRFYLHHGYGTSGPFRTEAVEVRGSWRPQKARGTATACRFMVKHDGRWYRLWSEHRNNGPYPHFITVRGERIMVSGVCP